MTHGWKRGFLCAYILHNTENHIAQEQKVASSSDSGQNDEGKLNRVLKKIDWITLATTFTHLIKKLKHELEKSAHIIFIICILNTCNVYLNQFVKVYILDFLKTYGTS